MIQVLDHGSVQLIEAWGSDENVIRAARQSTDGAFRGWGYCCSCGLEVGHRDGCDGTGPRNSGDERLLRYLYTHKHMTPFEMAGAILEIKAPIFVFREWHRHRTQSYNEMSARYMPLPDENYIPSIERVMMRGGANKQAQGLKEVSEFGAVGFCKLLEQSYVDSQTLYESALELGVPKELARLVLPVGRYSKMWASANLRNWLQFLTLRNAPDAQWEIQEYARAVETILTDLFPRTLSLFKESR